VHHAGGFLFFKDSSQIDSIYRNTFWNNYRIVGFDYWRMSKFVFVNNIVADPWLAYNADTTGFVTDLFAKMYGQYPEVILSVTPGARISSVYQSNTFAVFPKIPLKSPVSPNGCVRGKEGCALLRDSLQNVFLPKSRFYTYTDSVRRDTVSKASPKVRKDYMAMFVYMPYDVYSVPYTGLFWTMEHISSVIPTKNYSDTLLGADDQMHVYSYKGVDSSVVENKFHYFSKKPAPDTLGRILQITSNKTKGDSALDNFYIKSIPFNLDSTSPDFLTPVWSDYGVDSVVLGKAWAPVGESAPMARGAMQPMVVTPTPEEPEPGPVGIQSDRQGSKGIRLTAEGFLVFANPMQGICYVYALDGRMLGVYRIQNGRSLMAIGEQGAFVLRWQQQGIWRQQKMMRW
jgi:hypothetical protein